jgi:hypothetical protein
MGFQQKSRAFRIEGSFRTGWRGWRGWRRVSRRGSPVDTALLCNSEPIVRVAYSQPNCCALEIAGKKNLTIPEWNGARLPAWRQCNDRYARKIACPDLRLNVVTAAHSAPPL